MRHLWNKRGEERSSRVIRHFQQNLGRIEGELQASRIALHFCNLVWCETKLYKIVIINLFWLQNYNTKIYFLVTVHLYTVLLLQLQLFNCLRISWVVCGYCCLLELLVLRLFVSYLSVEEKTSSRRKPESQGRLKWESVGGETKVFINWYQSRVKMGHTDFMLGENGSWLWFRRLKELKARDMWEKGICLYYEGKFESNHDCKFGWPAVLLVNKNELDDDAILIMSDEKRKTKEVDLME